MIENAVTIAFIVLFIHASMWEDMIFGKTRELINPKGFWAQPLFGCPICMTPWYGTLVYYLMSLNGMTTWEFIPWLFTIGTAAGIAVVFVYLSKMEVPKEELSTSELKVKGTLRKQQQKP